LEWHPKHSRLERGEPIERESLDELGG